MDYSNSMETTLKPYHPLFFYLKMSVYKCPKLPNVQDVKFNFHMKTPSDGNGFSLSTVTT